jgi:hypothetical protein
VGLIAKRQMHVKLKLDFSTVTSRAVALRVVAATQVPATILALASVAVVAVQVSQDALVALP